MPSKSLLGFLLFETLFHSHLNVGIFEDSFFCPSFPTHFANKVSGLLLLFIRSETDYEKKMYILGHPFPFLSTESDDFFFKRYMVGFCVCICICHGFGVIVAMVPFLSLYHSARVEYFPFGLVMDFFAILVIPCTPLADSNSPFFTVSKFPPPFFS